MRFSQSVAIMLTVVVAIVFGCKDDGVSVDGRAEGLYARVVDASGGSLTEVDMHYIFYTNSNAIVQNVGIQYSLQTPQVVTLTVLDPFNREVKRLVNAVQQPAGAHFVLFDSSVTNGVYTFVLQIGDSVRRTPFFIRHDDVAQLLQRAPLIQSDQNGLFFLSHSTLGIGRTIGGETVHDSISVVLAKAGYQTLVETFWMDTTKAVDKVFNMVTTDREHSISVHEF